MTDSDGIVQQSAHQTTSTTPPRRDAITNRIADRFDLLDDASERALRVTVRRFEGGQGVETTDEVVVEEPLEIQIAGRSIAMIMRTPGHDPYLAVGFLLSEGIIRDADDVVSIDFGLDRDGFPQRNVLDLRLRTTLELSDVLGKRTFAVTSSCGICGTASIEAARIVARTVPDGGRVTTTCLQQLEAQLRPHQAVFSRTGGLHAAGLFDVSGTLLLQHEDVGRHNAVDKVFGQFLIEGRLPARDAILLVSGRASFELVQKAATAGVPILAAIGAPSSLAVEMAAACNLTLVGLLRNNRFVVYTKPERVRSGS